MRILKVKLYWKIEIKNYETLWKNMGHLACLYVFVGGNLSCAQSEALSCTRHCRVKIYKLVPPFFLSSHAEKFLDSVYTIQAGSQQSIAVDPLYQRSGEQT